MNEPRDRFLRACRREPVDRTPIWIMRQAGRYLPEYRAIRERRSMLECCTTPELAAEITLLPIRRFDLDAAILFSDLTIPFTPMGAPFTLQENVGPVIESPIRSAADVQRLRPVEPEADLAFTLEAIRTVRRDLRVPLIGFCGAPFTWACYLIEGRGSRDFARTRAFLHAEPAAWNRLMELLTESALRYLTAQVAAGAQAVQLFDSWAGILAPHVYREAVLPHVRRLFDGLRPLRVPAIHFGVGTATLLEAMRDAGGDVIGVDWRTPLGEARRRLGDGVALQGNLDPTALLAGPDALRRETQRVLDEASGRPGHVFNLGHGVLPATPPEQVALLVDLVHAG
ncbi:MAG TPA: uroporphyrinogen decarboxylase [Chthonomonadales bacterium]|nr:uroporphyrinogen decarboxylase [Chthonomonadales bacterium]